MSALPSELAAWTYQGNAWTSATDLSNAQDVPVTLGQTADATLHPTPEMDFPVAAEKPGTNEDFGGLAKITVKKAGTYRVALGDDAWIDIISEGKALPSSAHAHGPACSTIHKMVDFQLVPGHYILQLAGSPTDKMPVLVTRLP
ncbi:homogentisate 1,2-dioxygenase [Altericroceibacterium spongiae]|uniref:Homogentisate 1,2-dioxygenase n=2 Tax=Altericroceibacterium spongiae TaxID=2320269 RepID=A0A420EMA1_9SPHN|nr:homogentisate 1,2-dioxygenase [Altericroceibacterium spongiae]